MAQTPREVSRYGERIHRGLLKCGKFKFITLITSSDLLSGLSFRNSTEKTGAIKSSMMGGVPVHVHGTGLDEYPSLNSLLYRAHSLGADLPYPYELSGKY